MLTRLEKRLPLLIGGARDAPARQQTLRATIEWSVDLLSPQEDILFRRLAVFVGGCTLETAEAVTNANGGLDVFGGMERLIEQSLLRQEEHANGDLRFTMLETIREFAGELLEASEDAGAMRRAHATYFLALALQLQANARGSEQGVWLERLETEHDNLRAALAWLIDHDVEAALELAEGLFWLWIHHGHVSEARRSPERVLARSEGLSTLQYAEVLNQAGKFAADERDFDRSEEYSRKSLALLHQLGDTTSLPYTLLVLGGTAAMRGKRDEAVKLLEEAVALCRANGDDWGCATALSNLADIAQDGGEYPRAIELVEEQLALYRKLGDQLKVLESLSSLGWLALSQGNDPLAESLFIQALRGEPSRARQYASIAARIGLGVLARRSGNVERAVTLLDEALAQAHEFEDRIALVFCLGSLGDVARDQGQVRQAAMYYRESLDTAGANQDGFAAVDTLEALAGLAVDTEHFALGAQLFGQADAQRTTTGTRRSPVTESVIARDVKAARAHLGEADFERALAAGRALTRDEAIAAAFEAAATLSEAPEVPISS
jgi:tetratricopeptide (TPR) repeat protein